MPALILVAKGAILAVKNWKTVLIVLFVALLLVVFFPIFVLSSFLPSTDEAMNKEYQMVAKKLGLDWIELVVYDTVRNDNDLSKVAVNETPFDFLRLSYVVKEKITETSVNSRVTDGETEYQVVFVGGSFAWISDEDLARVPSGSYAVSTTTTVTWNIIESGTVTSYTPIVSALRKVGCSEREPVSASDALSYVDGLGGSETYEATFEN